MDKLASSHGLVVKQRTHDWKIVGSNPHGEDQFSGTIHLDQKPGAKRDYGMFQPGIVACDVILLMEGWTLRTVGLKYPVS
jgi:hypothetical protein